MKTLIAFGFGIALSGSLLAGECGTCCASKMGSKDKTASACPVSRAKQQAKASAGSIKEHAKASKAALKMGLY